MTDQERVHTLLEHGLDRQAVAAILGVTEGDVVATMRDGNPLPPRGGFNMDELVQVMRHTPPDANTGVGQEQIFFNLGSPVDRTITVFDHFTAGESLFGTITIPGEVEVNVSMSSRVLHLASGAILVTVGQTLFNPDTPSLTRIHQAVEASGDLSVVDDAIVTATDSVLIAQLAFEIE